MRENGQLDPGAGSTQTARSCRAAAPRSLRRKLAKIRARDAHLVQQTLTCDPMSSATPSHPKANAGDVHDTAGDGAGLAGRHIALCVSNGPGKLCHALGIDRSHYGVDLCRPPLYLAEGPAPRAIRQTPRIGVDYAGK